MLEDIKSLLNINDTSKDAKLNVLIKHTKVAIQNECNRDDFPVELENVVVDFIVAKANETQVASRGSVSFSHQMTKADLANYEEQLSRFRLVRVL